MSLELVAIISDRKAMEPYLTNEFCSELFQVYQDLYPKIGFHLPWVGYFFLYKNEVIRVGGFNERTVVGFQLSINQLEKG